MAFSPETKILTRRGWKRIRDIGGRDRVLVRNFLGEAEFIQPFALRKSHYEGELVTFGSKYWAATTTPEHKIIYDKGEMKAENVKVDKHKRLYRKFRYIREDRKGELIHLKERTVSVSDEDWYTIVAYTLAKGYISKDKNPRLKFMLDYEEMPPLVGLFDMWGITYNIGEVNGNPVLTVNRDNNLARKLKRFLGARARREMGLPDKAVFSSSQALMKHFVGVFTTLAARPSQKRPKQLIFTHPSRNFAKSMEMLCLMVGFPFNATESYGKQVCYVIPDSVGSWSVTFVEKTDYSGDVYDIDLFDGLIYVTERNLPVWLSPK